MAFWERYWRSLLISLVVIVASAVLYIFGGFRPIEHVISLATQPLQSGLYQITSSWRPINATTTELTAENNQLKQQLAEATSTIQELEQTLTQYQEFSTQLAFAQQQNYTIIPAEIISRLGQGTNTQLFQINQGSDAGLVSGQAVTYGAGLLVGQIHDVTATSATVAPVTSPFVTLQATIQNDEHATGLVKGEFGTGVIMDFILKDQVLNIGDRIVTSGSAGDIPAGLLIGTVQHINDDTSALFKTATITPELPYDQFSIVSIIVVP